MQGVHHHGDRQVAHHPGQSGRHVHRRQIRRSRWPLHSRRRSPRRGAHEWPGIVCQNPGFLLNCAAHLVRRVETGKALTGQEIYSLSQGSVLWTSASVVPSKTTFPSFSTRNLVLSSIPLSGISSILPVSGLKRFLASANASCSRWVISSEVVCETSRCFTTSSMMVVDVIG